MTLYLSEMSTERLRAERSQLKVVLLGSTHLRNDRFFGPMIKAFDEISAEIIRRHEQDDGRWETH